MNRITAWEIYSNPLDLQISALPNKEDGGKLFLLIARGPEHNFKQMLSGQSTLTGLQEIYDQAILPILEACMKEGKDLSFVEQDKCLSEKHIEWIRTKLLETGIASTFEMSVMA